MPALEAMGPLHGYELAFLRAGHVLVREWDHGIVLMWLTARTPSAAAND